MKTCKKCKEEKQIESFTVDARYKDGRYPWCAECRRAWRKDRLERQRELSMAWREKNLMRNRDLNNAHYAKHKEKLSAKRREYDREQYRTNPEVKERKDRQAAEKNRRRKALLYGIDTQHHTEQEWIDLCARYDHRCLCCRERKPLSRDHVVPVTSGGLDTIDNIQPLCKGCNSRKNDRMIDYRPGWEV